MRLRLALTRTLRPFSTKNCAFEVVFSFVIRSSKNTGRGPLATVKVEVFGAYGGRKQDGGEQSFTRLTALASKGSADITCITYYICIYILYMIYIIYSILYIYIVKATQYEKTFFFLRWEFVPSLRKALSIFGNLQFPDSSAARRGNFLGWGHDRGHRR